MSEEIVAKDNVPKVEKPTEKNDGVKLDTTSSTSYLKSKEKKDDDGGKDDLSTKEAYFEALNLWVKNANIQQNAMALFPWFLYSTYPQVFQPALPLGLPGSGTMPVILNRSDVLLNNQDLPRDAGANNRRRLSAAARNANLANRRHFNFLRILDTQAQTDLINRHGGYEHVIAPFWKRAIAEIIDMIMLLLVKIVITFTLMSIFDWDWDFESNNEALNQAIDKVDLTSFINVSMDILIFSSNFLALEVVIKMVVCLYEALWTSLMDGSTPGKLAMNLKVVYCEALVLVPPPQQQQQQAPQGPPQLGFRAARQPMKALIYPAEVPSLFRAFLRAAAKNLIMTILFPICFVMIFFKHNRTSYDIYTKTVVIEINPNPNFVLRENQ